MTAPVNRSRGDVSLVIDGTTRTLCLTLGGLARLQDGLKVADLSALQDRLRQLTAADVPVVVCALLADDDGPRDPVWLSETDLRPAEAAAAIAACFERAL